MLQQLVEYFSILVLRLDSNCVVSCVCVCNSASAFEPASAFRLLLVVAWILLSFFSLSLGGRLRMCLLRLCLVG